jgi:hypothetical protein
MPKFNVYEVYEESRIWRRQWEVEADSADEAQEQCQNEAAPPPPDGLMGDETYSESGWFAQRADENDATGWGEAISDLEQRLFDAPSRRDSEPTPPPENGVLYEKQIEVLRAIADPEHCLTRHTVDGLRRLARGVLAEIAS